MTRRTIKGSVFFIKEYTPAWSVQITKNNGIVDEVKSKIITGEFAKPLISDGIGSFEMELINIGGKISGEYNIDDEIVLYADMSSGTTRKFKGKIKKVDDNIDKTKATTSISGIHIASELITTYVTAHYENMEISAILKTLITSFLPNKYTPINWDDYIVATGQLVTISFDRKLFKDCIVDLLDMSNIGGNAFDCYVDDDFRFHLFQENSISNDEEAIVQGDNLQELKRFSQDSFEKRNKVTIIGKDNEGLPIMFTSGTGNEEYVMQDNTISNYNEAKKKAEAILNIRNKIYLIKGTAKCKWMETLNPGDYIWMQVKSQYIEQKIKILEHKIILDRGTIWSECKINKETEVQPSLFTKITNVDYTSKSSDNPNALKYSYNMTFDDMLQIESTSNLSLSGGECRQTSTDTNAQFITINEIVPINITIAELRLVGQDLDASTVQISVNGGANYTTLSKNTIVNITTSGNLLKIKVILVNNTLNPLPILRSLCILYS